jgi:type III secretory pathway component EscU
MPIHIRPIAISAAVVTFFALSFVGLFNSLAPLTCCKRAFIGAVLAYIVISLVVKIINAVLISAIIDSHTNKQKEK